MKVKLIGRIWNADFMEPDDVYTTTWGWVLKDDHDGEIYCAPPGFSSEAEAIADLTAVVMDSGGWEIVE